MMPFVLLLSGLLLILIEFYLPGIVIGIIGACFVLAAIILFGSQTDSLMAIILFVAGSFISVGLLIRFALWRIVHAKPGYSIYLSKDQEGFQASSFDASAIGKIGTVLSDLKPGGYIVIEGKPHQALSLTGYLSKGEKVIVVSGQEESLIVQKMKKED